MDFGCWILVVSLFAQDRPGLFFREDWKETPPEIPVRRSILHLDRRMPCQLPRFVGAPNRPASASCAWSWSLPMAPGWSPINPTAHRKIGECGNSICPTCAGGVWISRRWSKAPGSGGGTPASSRVDWIEVYGKQVKQ